MKDVGGAVLAGCSPSFLGRERAAVDVDVGPERRSPRYHETCLALDSVDVCLAVHALRHHRDVIRGLARGLHVLRASSHVLRVDRPRITSPTTRITSPCTPMPRITSPM